MLKPTITLGVICFVVLAFGVFKIEQNVQQMRGDLSSMSQQLVQEREAIQVLKAEWSYLNQPSRIEAMLEDEGTMERITTAQLQPVDALPIQRKLYAARTSEVAFMDVAHVDYIQ